MTPVAMMHRKVKFRGEQAMEDTSAGKLEATSAVLIQEKRRCRFPFRSF